jgi:Kef-type K+ transport system membrane component KefB
MGLAGDTGMLSLIISVIVFFVASFLLHRYLDDWGLDKKPRALLVLVVASVISYGASAIIDKITGEPSIMDNAINMQMPKELRDEK